MMRWASTSKALSTSCHRFSQLFNDYTLLVKKKGKKVGTDWSMANWWGPPSPEVSRSGWDSSDQSSIASAASNTDLFQVASFGSGSIWSNSPLDWGDEDPPAIEWQHKVISPSFHSRKLNFVDSGLGFLPQLRPS